MKRTKEIKEKFKTQRIVKQEFQKTGKTNNCLEQKGVDFMESFYRYFKKSNWQQLDIQTKKTLLQKLEDAQAQKQNRQSVEVQFQKLSSSDMGAYSPITQKITLNQNQLDDSYEVMDTVIHEGHHREQHLLAMGDTRVMSYLDTIPHLRADVQQQWRENMSNYNTTSSYEGYFLQPIEIDTVERTYGEMVWNNELYGYPEYQQFLAEKNNYIQKNRENAMKIYGPDYMKKLDEIREISKANPIRAGQLEQEYRVKQQQYERNIN